MRLIGNGKALEVPLKGDSEWLPQSMAGRVDFGFSGPRARGPSVFVGFLARAGTPKPVIDRLNAALRRVV